LIPCTGLYTRPTLVGTNQKLYIHGDNTLTGKTWNGRYKDIYVSWTGLETKTQNWVFVDHILDRKISIEEKSKKKKECEQVITEEHIRDAIKQRCATICIWGLKP
jgi:hypothetical protein